MYELIADILNSITVVDIIDIVIITFVIYKVLTLLKGTRTSHMMMSVFSILALLVISKLLGLRTTSWVISNITTYLLLIIVIIFQPELRRALMVLGESSLFGSEAKTNNKVLEEIVKACTMLANRQIGALIVLERNIKLESYVTLGQLVDAEVTRDLLISIFIPYSPLHDGAVLISGGRMTYASCILPLTEREKVDPSLGTRHRAAIGITEETDSVAVVVSEERGSISVVVNGILSGELNAQDVADTLETLMGNGKKEKSE